MGRHNWWTDERIDLLKRSFKEGVSCNLIAKTLGHGATRNSVIGKLHRLGLIRDEPYAPTICAPQGRGPARIKRTRHAETSSFTSKQTARAQRAKAKKAAKRLPNIGLVDTDGNWRTKNEREKALNAHARRFVADPLPADEAQRLADEAIAQGKITRCKPGQAFGSRTFFSRVGSSGGAAPLTLDEL